MSKCCLEGDCASLGVDCPDDEIAADDAVLSKSCVRCGFRLRLPLLFRSSLDEPSPPPPPLSRRPLPPSSSAMVFALATA